MLKYTTCSYLQRRRSPCSWCFELNFFSFKALLCKTWQRDTALRSRHDVSVFCWSHLFKGFNFQVRVQQTWTLELREMRKFFMGSSRFRSPAFACVRMEVSGSFASWKSCVTVAAVVLQERFSFSRPLVRWWTFNVNVHTDWIKWTEPVVLKRDGNARTILCEKIYKTSEFSNQTGLLITQTYTTLLLNSDWSRGVDSFSLKRCKCRKHL